MNNNELKPCPKCGSVSQMEHSVGGATIYYGIYCQNKECGFNNRHHNSSIFAYGLGGGGGFPPQDRNKAISEWNAYSKEPLNER